MAVGLSDEAVRQGVARRGRVGVLLAGHRLAVGPERRDDVLRGDAVRADLGVLQERRDVTGPAGHPPVGGAGLGDGRPARRVALEAVEVLEDVLLGHPRQAEVTDERGDQLGVHLLLDADELGHVLDVALDGDRAVAEGVSHLVGSFIAVNCSHRPGFPSRRTMVYHGSLPPGWHPPRRRRSAAPHPYDGREARSPVPFEV